MNQTVDNPAPSEMTRRMGVEYQSAMRYAYAHRALMSELIDSITENPARTVSTPGFGVGTRMTGAEVIEDLLAGKGSEANTHALMRVLGRCASGQLDHETHLLASGLLAMLARKHADFHAGEMA